MGLTIPTQDTVWPYQDKEMKNNNNREVIGKTYYNREKSSSHSYGCDTVPISEEMW